MDEPKPVKKIRVLTVGFDASLNFREIPSFRGAIINKVGQENILFHNHLDDTKYRYSYPLIQYKLMAQKPTILCIEQGVDEIHNFFEKSDWALQIGKRKVEMRIKHLHINTFTMQLWNRRFEYSLLNWLALNQQNHQKYEQIESLAERLAFLERILKANILSFAKGIDWLIESPVEVKITDLLRSNRFFFKNKKLLGFTLNFKTNVFLPNFIGLGKSVSRGFGTVKQLAPKQEDQQSAQ